MAALGRLCFRTTGQYTARRPRAAILRADDARIVRRGATRERVETTTRIHLADDGVARVQSSLRDEMVGRDGSAAADGLKPTATFGGRFATKDKNQRVAYGVASVFRLIPICFRRTCFVDAFHQQR